MSDATPKTIFLKDYQKPDYLIPEIQLCFDLHETQTHVSTRMKVICNSQAEERPPLVLNGEELELISVKVNGKTCEHIELSDNKLIIEKVPKRFTLEIENIMNPKANTALDGLYKSGPIFCTQNEPEGFRRITYFMDRSDVMSKYTCKIIADKKEYPILLSNGNEIGRGDYDEGKHWVEWEDPFVKPCYLFALVAGDLGEIRDTFTTRSGREIDLIIYCDKGNEDQCHHAMESLKNSMKWDEEVFGLEYDLNIYMIVAVDSFNMGAMENKGLNVFNTSCVLAESASATDDNFIRVEKVIGHEYFHNWTGNRVTCRDWFQLTLKEGLTVFRDQEFSADLNSRPVERIKDVVALRAMQFTEDAGPMAHPIKPSSYIEINNFYTATVYNKGAEIIRMIHTLIGKAAFRKGIDIYFKLFDGQAVTTEDFIHAMHKASGFDFKQFTRWYHQAGTPEVHVDYYYDEKAKSFHLTLEQSCPATPKQEIKETFLFPFVVSLIGKSGKELAQRTLIVKEQKESFVFENISEAVVPSLNRNFSAPVTVHSPHSHEDLMFLMAHETDDFNRWEAGQNLANAIIDENITRLQEGKELEFNDGYVTAFGAILQNTELDHSLKAMALCLPSEETAFQRQKPIAFDSTHHVRKALIKHLAITHQAAFFKLYESLKDSSEYKIDPLSIGRRTLKNTCLYYLVKSEDAAMIKLAKGQFDEASNMTDAFSALKVLSNVDCDERKQVLKTFYEQWKDHTLVMNKWLAVQALSTLPGTLEEVKTLMSDPVYDKEVPIVVRALIGTFAINSLHFNAADGSGYRFIKEQIMDLDPLNPQVAARMANNYKQLANFDKERQDFVRKELEEIIANKNLSTNTYEIVSKTLQQVEVQAHANANA